jgi:hypothetical protein
MRLLNRNVIFNLLLLYWKNKAKDKNEKRAEGKGEGKK